jgi:hypothetical protein
LSLLLSNPRIRVKLPGKRGKKSLLALMSLLAVLAILSSWFVDSLNSQNLRRIEEFRRIVAAEDVTTVGRFMGSSRRD